VGARGRRLRLAEWIDNGGEQLLLVALGTLAFSCLGYGDQKIATVITSLNRCVLIAVYEACSMITRN
jgi:hypothetical protein